MIKFSKVFLLFFLSFFVYSCGSDDDLCTSGEATPRMKLKFKNQATGKLKTLDTLYISVDYGNGKIGTLLKTKVDSVFLPLRIDDAGYTNFALKTNKNGSVSNLRVLYHTENKYVSPACGINKLYKDATIQILQQNPVLGTEINDQQIINENKTHFFLLF